MIYEHVPVMLAEVLKYLDLQPGKKYIDCTLGGAGYTIAIAKATGKKGLVVGVDLDELAIKNAKRLFKENSLENVVLFNDNFKNIKSLVESHFKEGEKFDGIVFDLGLSSAQLDDETRGFSFKGERPLDMSFGPKNERSTEEIINSYSLQELTDIFREYGEDRRAYQIAKAIVNARKKKRIKNSVDLIEIIESVVPFRHYSKINPATKIFQALRMETNDELNSLKSVLPDAICLLKPGGRLVVVSFHSGEDRIVKRFLRSREDLEILTKKPLTAKDLEISSNPRARSAKLRAASKK